MPSSLLTSNSSSIWLLYPSSTAFHCSIILPSTHSCSISCHIPAVCPSIQRTQQILYSGPSQQKSWPITYHAGALHPSSLMVSPPAFPESAFPDVYIPQSDPHKSSCK